MFTTMARLVVALLILGGIAMGLMALAFINSDDPMPGNLPFNPWGLMTEAAYVLAYAFVLGMLCEISDRLKQLG